MTKLSDKSVLFIDTSGQYTSMAQRLARDFDKVFYCTNWQHSFPRYNSYCAGMNVPEIERVDSPYEVIDTVDLIVFPDLFFGEFQDWLRAKGYIVFGAGSAERLETHRDEFFEMQKEIGLPVSKYEVVKGMTKLCKYLKDKENKWIKTNIVRGNGETFNYKNEKLSESRLNEMKHSLGAYSEEAIFCVCDPIDNAVEIGHDTFIVDGKQPLNVMVGLEVKDSAYISKVVGYDKIHEVLKNIDSKMSPILAERQYRGAFSTEVRWDGKKGYFGDTTNRMGQPPSDLQQEIYDNFSEIIWDVANGKVPKIEASKKYGVQVIIKSSLNQSQAIYFPQKYKNNVKIKNLMYKEGIPYHVVLSDIEMCEIGSVVATGSTMQEALDLAKKIASEVQGDCVDINCDALEEATAELKKLEKFGIKLF